MTACNDLFTFALGVILANEGGLVTDTAADALGDPGGVTNFGITQATLDRLGLDLRATDLTQEQAAGVYFDHYWQGLHGPVTVAQVSPAMALAVFDATVQHGLSSASRLLQVAIGATPDGVMGPMTRERIGDVGEATAIVRFHERRRLLLTKWAQKDPKRLAMVPGLVSRVDLMERQAFTMLVENEPGLPLCIAFRHGHGL